MNGNKRPVTERCRLFLLINNRSHEGPLSNMHLKTRAPLRWNGLLQIISQP